MNKMTSSDIRLTFLNFFRENKHVVLESSSLIPPDNSSSWITAGIDPFKSFFKGDITPKNKKITSCQKCFRMKDYSLVGITSIYNTFFELLGNYSIGDYSKKEALQYALTLLTGEKYFDLEINRLYITVYSSDDETISLWKSLGIKSNHIIPLETNFWSMDNKPAGPCTEIFYDRGEKYDKESQGLDLIKKGITNDRYIELWNIVFSEFLAKSGYKINEYEKLPIKGINSSACLERLSCILENTDNIYETSLFMPMIKSLELICKRKYINELAFKIIVDHIRTLTFAICDNASFDNSKRGYDLKLLLKRCLKYGEELNINKTFLGELASTVIDTYANTYPLLVKNKKCIIDTITKEELLFQKTILEGKQLLNETIKNSKDKVIPGNICFDLTNKYNFPLELIIEYAKAQNCVVDEKLYNVLLKAMKQMKKSKVDINLQSECLINYHDESKFIGYDKLGSKTSVLKIIKNNKFVNSTSDYGYIILKENPFFAGNSEQVSDYGFIKNNDVRIEVEDVVTSVNNQFLLKCKILKGLLKEKDIVLTHVLEERRKSITKNHSGAHILCGLLQESLGSAITNINLKVDERDFRLNFNYEGRLSDEFIINLENKVNDIIRQNIKTNIEIMSIIDAKKKGLNISQEEDYQDMVRVVTVGNFKMICSGTHVNKTKEIKRFVISSVENKGLNTYRIYGTTDQNVNAVLFDAIKVYNDDMLKLLEKAKKIIKEAADLKQELSFSFNINNEPPISYKDVIYNKNELEDLKEKVSILENSYNDIRSNKNINDLDIFLKNRMVINDINVIIAITKNTALDIIKDIADKLLIRFDNAFILLANVNEGNVNFIAKTNSENPKINCDSIIKELSRKCKGQGFGNKYHATGGGKDSTNLIELLNEIKTNLN